MKQCHIASIENNDSLCFSSTQIVCQHVIPTLVDRRSANNSKETIFCIDYSQDQLKKQFWCFEVLDLCNGN